MLALAATADRARADNTPYLGEVQVFAYNFCPVGWLPLDGRLIAIADNSDLFQLIGTLYGGDGVTNFALPAAKPATTLLQGSPVIQCIAIAGVFPPLP